MLLFKCFSCPNLDLDTAEQKPSLKCTSPHFWVMKVWPFIRWFLLLCWEITALCFSLVSLIASRQKKKLVCIVYVGTLSGETAEFDNINEVGYVRWSNNTKGPVISLYGNDHFQLLTTKVKQFFPSSALFPCLCWSKRVIKEKTKLSSAAFC